MNEERTVEAITDFANALESASVKLRMQFASTPEKEQKWSWNPSAITWEKAEGNKGIYERSKDGDSQDFKNLVKDLIEHNQKLSRDGVFCWKFSKGKFVGRKRRQ